MATNYSSWGWSGSGYGERIYLEVTQSTILNSITMANHIIEKSPFASGRTLFRRI